MICRLLSFQWNKTVECNHSVANKWNMIQSNMNKIIVSIQKDQNLSDSAHHQCQKTQQTQQASNRTCSIIIVGCKYEYTEKDVIYGDGMNSDEYTAKSIENMEKVNIRQVETTAKNANEILKEIQILRICKNHDYIRNLIDMIPCKNLYKLNQISLIFEYTDTTLKKIIHSDQYLTVQHIQYILYQIFCGIKYLHSFNIYHGDIQPHNIHINENTTIKIANIPFSKNKLFKDNITSYIAPELILYDKMRKTSNQSDDGFIDFAQKSDVWSIGCVAAELFQMLPAFGTYYRRKPLFPILYHPAIHMAQDITFTDSNEYIANHFDGLFEIIGTPSPHDIISMDINERMMEILYQIPKRSPSDLYRLFPGYNASGIAVLVSMLQFDPDKRLKIKQSLEIPFLAQVRDRQKEQEFDKMRDEYFRICDTDLFNLGSKLNVNEYRHLFIKEGIYCCGTQFIKDLIPFILCLWFKEHDLPQDVVSIIFSLCV